MEKSYLLIILRLFAILKTQFDICRLQDWHSYFKLSYEAESTWKSLQEGHEANMKPSPAWTGQELINVYCCSLSII